jgi:hypothetical protein
VHFAFSASPGRLDTLAERLRAVHVDVRGPVEHPGGDRSIYSATRRATSSRPGTSSSRGEGAREGVEALR